ncbi:O-antigen ligase family protein [Microbulbifer guangxiensis]|uniref:O-antigen ligase family protein n=1 Tax=Microbulbifer guangxiensis TaxID=2904249 RepID=UPI001F29E8A5|nr:O-antigen ligase family protein [Microbulbifer guangxiensis]
MKIYFRQGGIYLFFLVLLTVGVPGLSVVDQFARAGEVADSEASVQVALRVFLNLFCLSVFSIFFIVGKIRLKKKVCAFALPYILLFAYYFFSSFFLFSGADKLVPLYRAFEWLLFMLIALLWLSSLEEARFDSFHRNYLKPALLLPLSIVLLAVIPLPELAYGMTHGNIRLGGFLFHPNRLGVIAACAFLYSYLLLPNGWKKAASMICTLLVLLFTYSRGAIIIFSLTIPLVILLVGGRYQRIIGLIVMLTGIVVLVIYSDEIVSLMSRGQGVSNVTSGSGRSEIWKASFDLIKESPILGYGFINGSKFALPDAVSWTAGFEFPAAHAHNDLLQSLLNGGVIALVVTLFIYGSLGFSLVKARHLLSRREHVFVVALVIQLLFSGLTELSLQGVLVFPGAVLFVIHMYLLTYINSKKSRSLNA